MKKVLNKEPLEPLIFTIRGQRVVLDADLGRLYGVTTMRFNEAFKRNRDRFPADFAFQLSAAEFRNLTSQFAISSLQASDLPRNNSSQVARSSHGGRRHLQRLAEIDSALLQHDSALRDLYRKLLPLLQPPADPPKRRIGFHADKDQ